MMSCWWWNEACLLILDAVDLACKRQQLAPILARFVDEATALTSHGRNPCLQLLIL
jgi:hypothetical protein